MKPNKAQIRAVEKAEAARREVQAKLDTLRTSVDRELRFLPKGRSWMLPMVGFACGIALTRGRKNPDRD
ncbi:MAG: hypothetical protein AAGN66_06875 [Acidobacteriota bacterium]